tara:strand:+ start:55 stop:300 length:246 start_codon:yes stop_codon:yes gene_type:complete
MKKILLTIFLLLFSISTAHAYSQFCNGFKAEYAVGYKQKKKTNINPIPPICPIQPIKGYGDPPSDYEHGYTLGYQKGLTAW